MDNYKLMPDTNWNSFSENRKVVDYIYSTFMPLVNSGAWTYMNFTSDSGIFEDEVGNSVLLGFDESGEEIISLNVSINTSERSEIGLLENTISDIRTEFGLTKISVK